MSLSIEQILSGSALILSVVAVLFTYKGIKVTKYIETITNQRILWIDTLRNDLAQILSSAIMYKQFLKDAEATKWWVESDGYLDQDPEERAETDDEISHRLEKRKQIISAVKRSENIVAIELAILKLNEIDDGALIDGLEKLRKIFLSNIEDQITDTLIAELRTSIKGLLKSEWERVKLEVRKGGSISAWKKTSRKNIFWN